MRKARQIYLHPQTVLIAALEQEFGEANVTGTDCGIHLVWTLPAGCMPAPKLAELARHEGGERIASRQRERPPPPAAARACTNSRKPVWINPADASARKITSGQVVRVFNDRGATLAGAIVTDRIREGVVMLQEGAWYDPDKPGEVGAMCKHGNINLVTIDKGTSKLAQGNTALVEVEAYKEPAPAVTAFTPPKGA